MLFQLCSTTATPTEDFFDQPIDIVYLWVDGSDSNWAALRDHYLAIQKTKGAEEHTQNRFADNGELRYSLRSVWKHAPFFNHIYIVTMNQTPAWLLPHPQISIIDHTEIFEDKNNLPTFNSHALESNLHRIPGLSEHFIYFNDDVFLGRETRPEDFFTQENITAQLKVLFEKSLSPSGPSLPGETAYRRAWRNTNAFLDAHYQQEPRFRLAHAPFALRKSFIENAETAFSFIFASNSSHKFRSDRDFNMTNGLLQYFWKYQNKIEIGDMKNMMVSLRDDRFFATTQKTIAHLKETMPHTFCLQDVMNEPSPLTKKLLQDFLEEAYPEAAPWERQDH
jgi:hypothetical protein